VCGSFYIRFLGVVELLPAPQQRALEMAFGITAGYEPDPFLVALAAYQLVCDASDESPVLLLVDDAHWLDRSSSGVLAFIARRLESEPIGLLVSVRVGVGTPLGDAGLPTLELERLSPAAAAALLDRTAPDLHPVLRARVLAGAAGNPLALVELVRAQGTADRSDAQLGDVPLTVTMRLERAFAAQLDGLPENTGPEPVYVSTNMSGSPAARSASTSMPRISMSSIIGPPTLTGPREILDHHVPRFV
jgi:hypothetical protein